MLKEQLRSDATWKLKYDEMLKSNHSLIEEHDKAVKELQHHSQVRIEDLSSQLHSVQASLQKMAQEKEEESTTLKAQIQQIETEYENYKVRQALLNSSRSSGLPSSPSLPSLAAEAPRKPVESESPSALRSSSSSSLLEIPPTFGAEKDNLLHYA